jgi:hypothetical protein
MAQPKDSQIAGIIRFLNFILYRIGGKRKRGWFTGADNLRWKTCGTAQIGKIPHKVGGKKFP